MGDADNEIKRLIAELRYDSPNGHYTAAKALSALGEVAIPPLIDVLKNSYLHLLYPQSRQKSQPLACSSWP